MAPLPSKVAARVSSGLKKFQAVLHDAYKRDVNESDTVTIVSDMLCDIFGYDKYAEVTSEHSIRSTFCDLAIRVGGDLAVLVEVKAIGLDLKDNHVKQAVDYAANQGCDWVALTNGVIWRAYRVAFTKPIQAELVLEVNLLNLNPRKTDDVELLALLSREAWQKSRLNDYAVRKQALSRFTVAAVVLTEPCLQAIRREVRRISRDLRVDTTDIEKILRDEVIKREVLEGEKADSSRRLVQRAAKRALRESGETESPVAATAGQAPG